MPSRRTARAAEAIRETVSTAILFELRDPRIRNVTVLSAEVSGDLRSAKVFVSVMGDEKIQALTMRGLDAARGFLQAKVADRLQTRNTPVLRFELDQGVKKSIEAARMLREALPAEEPAVADGELESEIEADGIREDESSAVDVEESNTEQSNTEEVSS